MTRNEAIERALQWIAGQENLFFAECSQAEEIIATAKAALALPEDSNDSLEQPSPLRIVPTMTSNNTSGHQQLANSKVVNAELYGLAVELADELAKYNAGLDPILKDKKRALRYLSLREASGEPMPYKVVRDGDKVRFL